MWARDYSTWIKAQVKRCRLVEGRDFIKVTQKGELSSTGQSRLEYHLTIDAGKHLAMSSNTERGTNDIPTLGGPWFVAAEICKALGLVNVSMACSKLDGDEKDDINIPDVTGRMQMTVIVNESGLYTLIMGSNKPAAKRFKKWVTCGGASAHSQMPVKAGI
jgi:hypothetical protein